MKKLFIIGVLFLLLAFACFFGPLKFVEGHGDMDHGIGRGGGFGMDGRSFGRGFTYGAPASYYGGSIGDYYNGEIPVYYPAYY